MTQVVGIDSNVLVYAGVVPKKPGAISANVRDLSKRAKLLLHQLEKDTIILPCVAMSELLVPVPMNQRGLLIAELTERFVCPVFDAQSAALAAALWAKGKKLPENLCYDDRHVLRADAMIIAAAKIAGARKFYSSDKRCRSLADLIMTGCDLPKRPDPTGPDALWVMDEIERGEI